MTRRHKTAPRKHRETATRTWPGPAASRARLCSAVAVVAVCVVAGSSAPAGAASPRVAAANAGIASVKPAAPCTKRALAAGLRRSRLKGRIDVFGCAGRFAYAGVIVNSGSGETDEVTVLFRANDNAWKTATFKYCQNGSVPARIRQQACESN
jgi:hypothetical protein